MHGQLCTVGPLQKLTRLFFYDVSQGLHVEMIDRRNREMRHLVKLVDEDGKTVSIPQGSRFVHVESSECIDLLENHLRAHAKV